MLENFNLEQLPYVELLKKERLPETSGIYFAVDSEQKIWYVGKAQNIRARWIGHHRYAQLEKINKRNPIRLLWYTCEDNEKTLTQLETYFIDTYYPILNQSKVEARKINPAEVELRNTLIKIAKYVILFGYEASSKEFGLPCVYLMYDAYHNPARILRSIFDAVNKRGGLRWSYYRRVKYSPIWKTKCNGIYVVVGCTGGVNELMQRGEAAVLAGVSLLKISDNDFQNYVNEKDWSQSYHPNIERYTNDPLPLLWSKDLQISQNDTETLKELNKKRTERNIGQDKPRGTKVRVFCTRIGWGADNIIETYKEAIEWFGGYELLGLKQTSSSPYRNTNGFKPHRVTVRIAEGKTYRALSAPISASSREELMQRFEKIKQLSSLHQRVKLEI